MKSALDKSIKLDLFVSCVDLIVFNVMLLLCNVMDFWPYTDDKRLLLTDFTVANIAYALSLCLVTITLHHRLSRPETVLRNTFRTSVLFIITNAAVLGMAHLSVPGFFRSASVAAVVFLGTTIERLLMRKFVLKQRSVGRSHVDTIIIGDGYMARKVMAVMNDSWNGYNLLGVFSDSRYEDDVRRDDDDSLPAKEDIKFIGGVNDAIDFLRANRVDEVYIALSQNFDDKLKEITDYCDQNMMRLYYIPLDNSVNTRKTHAVEFGDIYVMAQYKEPLKRLKNRMVKRCFDLLVSLCFLCTLFPIIYILVALISKITMPGPVFFKQKRTGFDGKDFYCYKFRSMKVNVDSDKVQATKDDPRITAFGKFLRHSNIDELPQFINVLKGDMSIVGPRPHMLAHTEYYSDQISDYMIRHYVKPGITGWAQTHGERGETRMVEDMERRVRKDIWYVEHWSFWLDIQIIFKTALDVIKGDEKAY
ncbi:MAG: undecaprenyl-phosphate glucose phosphotransferase [Prevotella sp.]|nr:undecaprenyl-phosphate glucose phosphotransferase [Prevotella sp.]